MDPILNNLVSFYKFENNANDSFGSNNGSGTNVTYSTSAGKNGYGAIFGGGNALIDIPDSNSFNVDRLTISAWVYSSVQSQSSHIFEKGPVNTQYSLFISSGSSIVFRTKNSDNVQDDLTATGLSIYRKYNLITATYDGNKKYIYLNGVLVNSKDYSVSLMKDKVGQRIGAYGGDNPAFWFYGYIDELGIWSRALEQSEINKIYLNPNYPFPDVQVTKFSDTGLFGGSAGIENIKFKRKFNNNEEKKKEIDRLKSNLLLRTL